MLLSHGKSIAGAGGKGEKTIDYWVFGNDCRFRSVRSKIPRHSYHSAWGQWRVGLPEGRHGVETTLCFTLWQCRCVGSRYRARTCKLTGFGFIHGIVIVKEINTGFLSDGQKNQVISFDPTTLKIKGRITTLANPNSMVYDRSSGRLFVGHKPSKSITVIRASSGEIEKVIPLGGVPEFPVTDGAGSIFVNINDQSEIVRIGRNFDDDQSALAAQALPVSSGLAFDEQKNRLFSACDNKLMAVMDAGTGKLISTLPIGDGPDAATFDPETRLAFSSNGDGTLTVIAEHGDGYAVVQNLRTEVGARTMTLDIKNHSIYLPTAKLGPPPAPTAENPNPPKHPTAVAGTFHLIVVTPIASR